MFKLFFLFPIIPALCVMASRRILSHGTITPRSITLKDSRQAAHHHKLWATGLKKCVPVNAHRALRRSELFGSKLELTWSYCSSAPHRQCSSQCHGRRPSRWLREWCLGRDPADRSTRRENIGNDEPQRWRTNTFSNFFCQKGTFISSSQFFSKNFHTVTKIGAFSFRDQPSSTVFSRL